MQLLEKDAYTINCWGKELKKDMIQTYNLYIHIYTSI